MAASALCITPRNVAARRVPHYANFMHSDGVPQYKVVIPSFDRPNILCSKTLSLLRRHGISMTRVAVFVSPKTAPNATLPEWQRYLDAFREEGFQEVRLLAGGEGLAENMMAALRWVGQDYFITMSDSVEELFQLSNKSSSSGPSLEPVPAGTLRALINHGFHLMAAGKFTAWSVNPSKSALNLRTGTISARLGLLDGNLTGCRLPDPWDHLAVSVEFGLVYDVAWSLKLWAAGLRFFRYNGLCVKHVYRQKGGQASLFRCPVRRRRQENKCLRALAREYPRLIAFKPKPGASLKTMLYSFKTTDEDPIELEERQHLQPGRPRLAFLDHPMSFAERKRRQRGALQTPLLRGAQHQNQNARKRPSSAVGSGCKRRK